MKQTLQVALYLEMRQFINSLRRSLQNPVGLVGGLITLIVIVVIVIFHLKFQLYERPLQQSETFLLELSTQERTLSLLIILTGVLFLRLMISVVAIAFKPYGFTQFVSETDLHYLFTTPLNSWKLYRTLILVRSIAGAGVGFLLSVLLLILVGVQVAPILMRDYVTQLQAGAWLLVGYYVLTYVRGTFFEFFGMWYALNLRRNPLLRWWVVGFVVVWTLLVVLAFVGGWMLAEARGAARIEVVEYAFNWFPTLILTLPARATADALLAVVIGWTPALGTMILLWGAGALWLSRFLTRYSKELLDLVAVVNQLDAGSVEDNLPLAVRQQIEGTEPHQKQYYTPALLERWKPKGIWALLWVDMLITIRTTPVWQWVLGLPLSSLLAFGGLYTLKVANLFSLERNPFFMGAIYIILLIFLLANIENMKLLNDDRIRVLPFSSKQIVMVYLLSGLLLFFYFALPLSIAGLLFYPSMWYLWLSYLVLTTSFTVTGNLLSLIYALLTEQPYLDTVIVILENIRLVVVVGVLLIGGVLMWLISLLGVLSILVAPLIVLCCVPLQMYLFNLAVELWRSYTPMV